MQRIFNSGRLVRSPQRFLWKALGCFLAAAGLLTVSTVNAGQREWNLNDSNQTNDFLLRGNGAAWLQETGGNGYLQITPAVASNTGTILFGDFDEGLVVKAFTFECDVKLGDGTNPPADGFSINYARSNDPTIANIEGGGSGVWSGDWAAFPDNAANLPEEGTQTGVAIGFDTWGLPGGANGANDLRGISIRVDGAPIAQFAIPNVIPPAGSDGTDPTYLETGPLSDADKVGTGQYLTWQPLKVDLDELGILNVYYKNTQVLTNFDTGFFPSPGRLVFTGRTGGSHALQAIDNLKITTIPSATFLITGLRGKADGFTITVNDAQGSVLNPSTVQLKLNGADLASSTFTVTKAGNISTVTYSHLPNFFPAGSTNLVSITASDNNGTEASLERSFVVRPYVQLDPAWIAPNGTYDTTSPGLVGYINQIAVGRGPGDANNKWNPLRQLAGGYIDPATGNPYPNLVDPAGGVNADGTFVVGGDVVFFDPFINMNGDVFNQGYDPFVNDAGAFRAANGFPDYQMPGIPGTTLSTDNIVMEAYTYVQLAAPKLYTFVVNSDDGFWVTFGPQHRSALSTSQNSSAAFVGKGSSDVEFDIAVPAGGAGVYRARLVYWEGGGGNNVEFFTRKDGGGNALVGDTANGGLAAYKPAGAGQALEPELVSAAPWPGQTGVRPDSQIQVILADGTGKNVDGNSVVVKVNGVTFNKTVAPKVRGMTRITAVPAGLLDGGVPNNVEVTWTAGGQSYTDTWSFTTLAYQALPEWLARPIGSGTDPGFAARVHQLGTLQPAVDAGAPTIGNRWHQRDQQMENLFGPSVATVPANQVQVLSTINFNGDEPLANIANFTGDVKIPGIPGNKASRNTDDIAMEVVTYIEFPNAGFYYMGVASDDGFNVIAREKLNRLPGLKILSPSTLFANQNNYVGAFARAGQNATTPAALPVPAVEAKIVAAVPAIADTELTNAAEIAGNIALIDRGTVSFADKIARARTAGAVAVIMVDNAPDRLPIEMGATENSVLPAVMITQADGATIKTALAAGEVRGSIGADTIPSLGFFNDGRGWDSGPTMFGFGISKPGVYPFRLIWFEGGGGANCEWFFEAASGTRVLINDPANAAIGLKAFRTAPPVTEPTEAEFNPPTIANGQVTLSWEGTGTLQESGNLIDWSNSASQANPQTVTPSGANPVKFYRIQVTP